MALPKLFVIGDSISIQYGPHLERMLAGACSYGRKTGDEKGLSDAERANGSNGGDSSMVLEYLRALERIGGFGCDVLLLNCGLHDIKTDPPTGRRQVGPEDYAANLQAILSLVPRLARRLVWVRTTPVDQEQHNRSGRTFQRFEKDVDLYNGLADRAMAARGIASADLHSFTRSLQGPLYEDGVHFRDEVRVRQAAFLAGFLSGLAAPGMV